MREMRITIPELVLIGSTRAFLGVGLGLLLADILAERRKTIGWTLLLAGALSTIPLASRVRRGRRLSASKERAEATADAFDRREMAYA